MDLADRVVLVTGAGRRIGRAIAGRLARDGARLAIHYHESAGGAAGLLEEVGGRGDLFPADLRDPHAAEQLPREVVRRLGRLDVLVNSAAVMIRQPFGSVRPEDWDQVLDLNLRAYFFVAQGAAPALRDARGRIINISDVGGLEPWPEYLPHSVSKAGVEMLTRGLARVLAPEVTVNSVAPGPVLLPDHWSDDAARRTVQSTPVGRLGTPDDAAEAVRFLLDADYMTGTTLVADGGRFIR